MSQPVRITNTMVIIKESYAAYQNKVKAPAHVSRCHTHQCSFSECNSSGPLYLEKYERLSLNMIKQPCL